MLIPSRPTVRGGIVVGALAAGLFVLGMPAWADDGWGTTDCSQGLTPSCELGAGTPGGLPAPGPSEPVAPRSPRPAPRTGTPNVPDDTVLDDPDLTTCSYVRSDFQPPAGGALTIAFHPPSSSNSRVRHPVALAAAWRSAGSLLTASGRPPVAASGAGPGAWYVWTCDGAGPADAVYRPPVWIADGPQRAAAQLPSVVALAQRARQQLRLPSPAIVANPSGEQLVNLPTWMWLTGGWAPVSATAAVPGVSVTARATPTSVVWSMGDGTSQACAGPGTPFPAGGDPTDASPDCGHVYRRSSTGQPGQAYPVTVTVHWSVTWAGAGQGGEFPDLTTTGTAAFRVAEAQALITGGH